MGTTYIIYTEAFIDNEWRCIDGWYKTKPYGKSEEELHLMSTHENSSRSYFGDAYSELEAIGKSTKFSELSKEIQEENPDLRYKYNWSGEKTEEESSYVTIDYLIFNNHVPKGFSNHGIIHKDKIAAFECGDIDGIWQDDEIDFSKLTELEMKCYEYYEWDHHWDWQYWFKKIKELVDFTVGKYRNNEWSWYDEQKIRLVVFAL